MPQGVWTSLRHAAQYRCAPFNADVGRQQMHITELQPLLKKVIVLRENPSTRDVAAFVEDLIERASTPAMAQIACDRVISMCNPKAWGDRHVEGFGDDFLAWQSFLGELSDLAAHCGQDIYDNGQRA